MFSLITMAADTQSASNAQFGSLIFMVVAIVVLYFIMIRPQKKKEKADAEMRKNLRVGDEVETIGGIVGFIVKVGKDTVVIETTSAGTKLMFKKWAIATNVTADAEAKTKKDAALPDKKSEKDDKPIEKD